MFRSFLVVSTLYTVHPPLVVHEFGASKIQGLLPRTATMDYRGSNLLSVSGTKTNDLFHATGCNDHHTDHQLVGKGPQYVLLKFGILFSAFPAAAGRLRSIFSSPLSCNRLTAKVSAFRFIRGYSVLVTTGTSMLCEVCEVSSYFFPVKMSCPTIWALAWPCFPGLKVVTSTILQGWPLSIT